MSTPGESRHAFLGTSSFATRVLVALLEADRAPAIVVSPPDRPKGRGRKLAKPPVAELALEAGLPLHQTSSVNEPDSERAIRASGAVFATVCAFGQLIREPLLSELEMLNVHPSLLPRWRGAAPVERAIMAGDAETGVSIMRLTEGLDSGPVALVEGTPIGERETFGELAPRLAATGGRLLADAIALRDRDELQLTDQSEAEATYAEKIGPADRRLDPARPAPELDRIVRGLSPHVGAWVDSGGDRLGIGAAYPLEAGPPVGEFAELDGSVVLGCGEGGLRIDRLQAPGGRMLEAGDYLRGRGLPARVAAG